MAPLSVAGMKQAINEIARNQLDREAFKKRAQACFDERGHQGRPEGFPREAATALFGDDRPQNSGIEILGGCHGD